MKKIILLLILAFSGITFSNECKWINEPNYILQAFIKKVNEKRIKNNIYCDNNHEYMIYYDGNNNIEIGFIFNEKEKEEITFDKVINFMRESSKLLEELSELKTKISYSDIPNYLIVRVYAYDPNENDIFMLFKMKCDASNEDNCGMYYNKEFFELFEGAVEVLEGIGIYSTGDIN